MIFLGLILHRIVPSFLKFIIYEFWLFRSIRTFNDLEPPPISLNY